MWRSLIGTALRHPGHLSCLVASVAAGLCPLVLAFLLPVQGWAQAASWLVAGVAAVLSSVALADQTGHLAATLNPDAVRLRRLGATRRQIARPWLAVLALTGVAGALLAVPLGWVLAVWARAATGTSVRGLAPLDWVALVAVGALLPAMVGWTRLPRLTRLVAPPWTPALPLSWPLASLAALGTGAVLTLLQLLLPPELRPALGAVAAGLMLLGLAGAATWLSRGLLPRSAARAIWPETGPLAGADLADQPRRFRAALPLVVAAGLITASALAADRSGAGPLPVSTALALSPALLVPAAMMTAASLTSTVLARADAWRAMRQAGLTSQALSSIALVTGLMLSVTAGALGMLVGAVAGWALQVGLPSPSDPWMLLALVASWTLFTGAVAGAVSAAGLPRWPQSDALGSPASQGSAVQGR